MQKRWIVLGFVLVVAAVVGIVWWQGSGNTTAADNETPSASAKRKELVRKKMAARSDLDLQPVRATGKVSDAETGKPIPGAVVLLSTKAPEGGQEPIHTRTDIAGGWTLEGIKPGRYTLSASADGYLASRNTNVRLASQAPLDLQLKPGGHLVGGTVSDIGGGPIDGAIIQVVRMDDTNIIDFARAPAAALTDDEGRYRIHLPDGTFIAAAHHADYVDKADETFEIDGKPKTVDFELVPGASIEGVVLRRGSDEPVAGAIVVANGSAMSKMSGGFQVGGIGENRVIADSEGRFSMRGLGSGVFSVAAVAEGGATQSPTEVALGIAESHSGVKVYVEPAFKISGFVVPRGDQEEGALEGVWVGALSLRPPGLTVARGPSESDGYFEILGVQPGSYMVAALGEDTVPNLTGTSAEVVDQDVTDVLVVMNEGVTITGRVTPPQSASVKLSVEAGEISLSSLTSAIGNAFVRSRSDEEGAFELKPVSPGSLTIVAEGDDGSHGEVTIDVGDQGAQDVVIELTPRAAVSGNVVDADGVAVADAKVSFKKIETERKGFQMSFSVKDNPMFGHGSPTRDDGTFVARGLEPGDYEVTVNPKRGPKLAWAEGSAPTEPMQVEVPERGIEGLTLRVEARNGVITGVVRTADGSPIPDAWVTAQVEGSGKEWMQQFAQTRSSGKARIKARKRPKPEDDDGSKPPGSDAMSALAAEPPVLTDQTGRFEIRNLRDGEYTLVAEAERGSTRAREEGVKPGADVQMTVESMASIEGRVRADGKPVARFNVTASGPANRAKTVVDQKGLFTVERLDPGKYQVTVESDEGTATVEVEIEAEQTADVELDLESFGTIKGRIVDSGSGEPILAASVIAQSEDGSASVDSAVGLLLGGGPRSGPDGKFELPRVKPGKGTVVVLDRDATTGGALAAVPYEIKAGQELDLGDVEGLAAGKVPADERGDLGLRTRAKVWAQRPLPPLPEGEDPDPEVDESPAPDGDEERERLFVSSVTVDGPAQQAGLAPGDEIISIDGQGVAGLGAGTADGLLNSSRIREGQTISLELETQGSGRRVTLTAAPRP